MALSEIMVVAGEASGDLHASHLVKALRAQRPELRFFGMGGQHLGAAGVELVRDAREVSVMGITEVLPKVPRILRVLKGLLAAARRRRPVLAVLVDIPDFNLRLAPRLKRLGIPVVYFISPMIWAWRRGRVHHIAGCVDQMLCILPFEEEFYRRSHVRARYVGSPVLEQVPPPAPREAFCAQLGVEPGRPTLALLPGSRESEIRRLLPVMLAAAQQVARAKPDLQLLVPVAPTVERTGIEGPLKSSGLPFQLFNGETCEVVGASHLALVASGTATLEAGLMQRPLVVAYRVSWGTYLVGKVLVKLSHFALPNLLAGRTVVPELLQGQVTPAALADWALRLWEGPERTAQLEGLEEVRSILGRPGAAQNAAQAVLSLLPS